MSSYGSICVDAYIYSFFVICISHIRTILLVAVRQVSAPIFNIARQTITRRHVLPYLVLCYSSYAGAPPHIHNICTSRYTQYSRSRYVYSSTGLFCPYNCSSVFCGSSNCRRARRIPTGCLLKGFKHLLNTNTGKILLIIGY